MGFTGLKRTDVLTEWLEVPIGMIVWNIRPTFATRNHTMENLVKNIIIAAGPFKVLCIISYYPHPIEGVLSEEDRPIALCVHLTFTWLDCLPPFYLELVQKWGEKDITIVNITDAPPELKVQLTQVEGIPFDYPEKVIKQLPSRFAQLPEHITGMLREV